MGSFFLFPFLLLFLANSTQGQSSFARTNAYKVVDVDGEVLENAFAGGMNFCHFGAINLDDNPPMDLLVFDKSGNRLLPFTASSIADSVVYSYAFQYVDALPPIANLLLTYDYDYDGDNDLFGFDEIGLIAFRNLRAETGSLSFSPFDGGKKLRTDRGAGQEVLKISGIDLPALQDVDGDGDMDLLTFDAAGSFVEFHSNQSMEIFGISDSLRFILADACWGTFKENDSNNMLDLGVSCFGGGNDGDREISRGPHAGSTLLALDLTGSGSQDLLIGDISFPSITAVFNGGSAASANMTSQEAFYPAADLPISLRFFPAAFYLDTDNDDRRDLVVAPNWRNNSVNTENAWLYRNLGPDSLPDFQFVQSDFIVGSMLDFGEGAYPAVFDLEGDGDADLVVGNYGYFESSGNYTAALALLENNGAAATELFSLTELDFAGLSGMVSDPLLQPTFGDLDGDGDADMLLGTEDGALMYFTNDAAAGSPASFSLNEPNYQGIDVGASVSPQLFDLNQDGLLDLIIGERNGNLNYFENTGTSTAAVFLEITETLGNVVVSNAASGGVGFSQPLFYRIDGQTRLLVGSVQGRLFSYGNIDGNLAGDFSLLDTFYMDILDGERSSLAGGDFNGDGLFDLVVGNYSGGLAFYEGSLAGGHNEEHYTFPAIKVFPNPSSGCFQLEQKYVHGEIHILNSLGQLVSHSSTGQNICLDRTVPGTYYLSLTMDAQTVNTVFVIY